MRCLAMLAVALAACGAKSNANIPDAGESGDAGPFPDAPVGCTTSIELVTPIPTQGMPVTLQGHIANLSGFATPEWVVTHDTLSVPLTLENGDMIAIFTPDTVGAYDAHFDIGSALLCQDSNLPITVAPPGANQQAWRVRIVPPPDSGIPPQEETVTITGATDNVAAPWSVDPGVAVASTVTDSAGAPVGGYLRFTPSGQSDEAVEAFAGATGDFQARVEGNKTYDALIVPSSQAQAPAKITGWQPLVPALTLAAADPIGGTVSAPDGSPMSGARVALAIGGVPTTIATTDAGGAWTALGHLGGTVDVTVVPPDGSGLPRLVATGTTIDASLPIAIKYAPAIATIDLAGVKVTSAGAAAPGATVTFTGSIAGAGTITAGTKNVGAGGVVSAVGHADGGGALLSTRVPKAALTAIVEPVPAVDAIVAVDTTGALASIDAPAQVAIHGVIDDPTGAPRKNVRVRLTPIGALAQGTLLVPATTTDAGGAFSIAGAPGGHYALVAIDLAQQYSRVDLADVGGGDLGTLSLGKAVGLTQQVMGGGSSAVAGASVTLLCATCTGVDATRPRGEAVTDDTGVYRLAVPDPGVGAQ